jgi:uncharacterized phage protein (TIGR02220 family)
MCNQKQENITEILENIRDNVLMMAGAMHDLDIALKEATDAMKAITQSGLDPSDFLVDYINVRYRRSFKKMTDTAKKQLNARFSEGYSFDQIKRAVDTAHRDKFHVQNKFKYLTPEYFTRRKSIELHCNELPEGRKIRDL